MLAPPNNSMELSSGFAVAQPDSAPLRPTAARRSLRLLRPLGVQLISRPIGQQYVIKEVYPFSNTRRPGSPSRSKPTEWEALSTRSVNAFLVLS